MRASDVIGRLRREGFSERPGRGSHVVFQKGERVVIVSNHRGDIPPGTLRAICRQAGWEYPPKR
ncbi:MAG: type II toxin-antitoxin system HicA family toxin [Alphaproteobacteria bacterium]|nr:type II toxin-antitoxin system HicA family toxin [Alphaproteobacteria bacterium]